MLTKLPLSKAQMCRYPPGCPVSIFTINKTNDNIPNFSTMKQGVLKTICSDNESNQYLYGISINQSDNSFDFLASEPELGFGIGCSVYVTSDSTPEIPGHVHLCKRNTAGVNVMQLSWRIMTRT
jgi:hypothetical protein